MITTIRPQQPSPSDAKSDAKSLLNEHVLLRGITWETFQSLVVELESQPSKRLTYDNGLLEIWMPLGHHESFKRWLGRIVEITTIEIECEMRSLSSYTWRRPDLFKGVEADECYYIQNEAIIRGKMEFDLTIDPPPDLAIEVDVTSLSLPRLPIYGALGVPEVWRVYEGNVQILALQDGDYGMVDRSLSLPLMTTTILQGFLDQAPLMGETSWAKMVQQWVRDSHDSDL
jgi:Uma2 family endonuclease